MRSELEKLLSNAASHPSNEPDVAAIRLLGKRRRLRRKVSGAVVLLLLAAATVAGAAYFNIGFDSRGDLVPVAGHPDAFPKVPSLSLLLVRDTTDKDVNRLLSDIEEMAEVESVVYWTSEKATSQAKKAAEGHSDYEEFAYLPDDAFPAELRVFLYDPGTARIVADRLSGREEIEFINLP